VSDKNNTKLPVNYNYFNVKYCSKTGINCHDYERMLMVLNFPEEPEKGHTFNFLERGRISTNQSINVNAKNANWKQT